MFAENRSPVKRRREIVPGADMIIYGDGSLEEMEVE